LSGQPQYPTTRSGEPTSAADSLSAATQYLGWLKNAFGLPYASQAAVAYSANSFGDVNKKYDPYNPSSTPYLNNNSVKGNATPSTYLYGNPSTGYAGSMTPTFNTAVENNYQNAGGGGYGGVAKILSGASGGVNTGGWGARW
jgi:hypothetical protein